MNLKGKIALVTGASSGIGRAIAIDLSNKGVEVIVHFNSNEKGAKETLKEVQKSSSGMIFDTDLMDLQQVNEMFESFYNKYDSLDILINNAGHAKGNKLDDYEVWNYQWENIFMSMVRVTNQFLLNKNSAKNKKIINISSVYGKLDASNPGFTAYSAAKAGVVSFTKNLAMKLAPDVLVNSIMPGYVWTPPWGSTEEEKNDPIVKDTLINRFIEVTEISQVAVMLAENDAITGENIVVDGGLTLKRLE